MWKGNYEALRPGAKNRELAAFLVRKGGKRKHIVQQMSVFFNFNVAARRDFYRLHPKIFTVYNISGFFADLSYSTCGTGIAQVLK